MLSFGQRLKLIRREAQLTQLQLAENIGVSVQSVSKWECDSTMPDISQIVPLAAALGVTTDCLLGMGTSEKEDRERLLSELEKEIDGRSEFTYENNFNYEKYSLIKEYLKKYPLDYEMKICGATYLFRFLQRSIWWNDYTIPEDEKSELLAQGMGMLRAVVNQDKDAARLISARCMLIRYYNMKKDFSSAKEMAMELPDIHNIRDNQLLWIYQFEDQEKNMEKCLELAEKMAHTACVEYIEYLSMRGRRISIFGTARKREAIEAWRDMETAARQGYRMFKTEKTAVYVMSALASRANDHVAIDELDEALTCAEDLCSFDISFYNDRKNAGDSKERLEVLKNEFIKFFPNLYSFNFSTPDNILANHERYKKCEEMLNSLE
ncbi:MAG: helix-turn-helix transcriptional regulator [Ruminococcaceae bacterium]|nr:helix-turn-helix transcriptional regulator [Oscillospiraceae bacterium]